MEGRVGVGRGELQTGTQELTPACNPLIHNSQRPSKHESTPLYSQTHMHICKHTYGMGINASKQHTHGFNIIYCGETSNRLS